MHTHTHAHTHIHTHTQTHTHTHTHTCIHTHMHTHKRTYTPGVDGLIVACNGMISEFLPVGEDICNAPS